MIHGRSIHRTTRTRRAVSFLAAGLAAALLGTMAPAATATPPQAPQAAVDPAVLDAGTDDVAVIVRAVPGGVDVARAAAAAAGATIGVELPLVDGFAATLPTNGVAELAASPSVVAITLDGDVELQESTGSSSGKSVYPKAVGAEQAWSNGLNGEGVTVALIDTGIAEVPDLAGRILPVTDHLTGEVTPCANFTGEATCDDSYGHGTFIAGIIAGDGSSSDGAYKGIAPKANLLSVKIAGRDGSADVSTLLAAIQWVVSFKDEYGVRVLNLSLGTTGTGSYRTDPLNYAVQKAWAEGIVVVVAASNLGPEAGSISKPGDDPWVITVGAIDDRATPGTGDDSLPDFSGRGPTVADGIAKPDVVAPGGRIISLRAPGSAVDQAFPDTVIAGWYRRGSGTSMSAGVVSGAAALLVDADPAIQPNRVKLALLSTARAVASNDPLAVGAGLIDVNAATTAPAGEANHGLERSNGLGFLDTSRGEVYVTADDGSLLGTLVNATLTLQLLTYDPITYTGLEWTGSRWYTSQWYGSRWYGSRWYGSRWYGSRWYGSRWYEESDSTTNYGTPLSGGAWLGAWL